MTFAEKLAESVARTDLSIQRSMGQQARRIVEEASTGVFRVDACQNGPRHNCELNISN